MVTRYEKTALGQRELRERSHALPPSVRMLLVMTNGLRTDKELMRMVRGAKDSDFAMLVDRGLVSAFGDMHSAPPLLDSDLPLDSAVPLDDLPLATPAPTVTESTEATVAELYDSLNAMAKEQLGLFKGYRFALDIERATGLEELQQVALRLIDEVRKTKGALAAQRVKRALGLVRSE